MKQQSDEAVESEPVKDMEQTVDQDRDAAGNKTEVPKQHTSQQPAGNGGGKLPTKWVWIGIVLALVAALTITMTHTQNPAPADQAFPYHLGGIPSPTAVLHAHYDPGYINLLLAAAPGKQSSNAIGAASPNSEGQGIQESCVAWSTSYNYDWLVNHNLGDSTSNQVFSPSYIYNQIDNGRNDGSHISDALNLLVTQGADTLAVMPYNQYDCTTQPTSVQQQEAVQTPGLSWTPLWLGTPNLQAMKAALAKGPIEAETKVYNSLDWGKSGEISLSDMTGGALSHAICIVGYDDNYSTPDGPGAFKFLNSWGSDWGQGGYGWMSYGYAQQNFTEAEVMYVKATTAAKATS
jgi:hypothetical protein